MKLFAVAILATCGLSYALLQAESMREATPPQSINQSVPSLNATVAYIMPVQGISDVEFPNEVERIRTRLGEGSHVKVGFTFNVFIPMSTYDIDTSDSVAIKAALANTFAQINRAVRLGKENGIPVGIFLISSIRNRVDGAKTAAVVEDRRNHQWYSGGNDPANLENGLATNWWSQSQYARKQQAVRQAYIREVGKYIAAKMVADPDTLVAVAGDGEIEMSSEKWTDSANFPGLVGAWADYSPFTVLEFQDWLRGTGMYAAGQPLAGQAYQFASRYTTDAAPNVDTSGDGHTLNGDFGTNFTTWSLKHFPWSLSDDYLDDPNAIPASVYNAGGFDPTPNSNPSGFDPPRTCPAVTSGLSTYCSNSTATLAGVWWNTFNLFRQEMIWRSNKDFAKWITTSADPISNATVPSDRFYSGQVPADHLFAFRDGQNRGAADLGVRLTTSASPWWTADVSPSGGIGITAYTVRSRNFDNTEDVYYQTLAAVAPVLSQRNIRYALIEWNPSDPFTNDPTPYRQDMAIIDQYRPHLMIPFFWNTAAMDANPNDEHRQWRVLNSGFETALKEWIDANKNGKPSDGRIVIDAPPAPVIQPFQLTGYALDRGTPIGPGWPTGVDAVEIYATPVGGGTETPIGTATYGGARSDAVTAQGVQFRPTGFTRTVSGLAPGHYTFQARARSTITGLYSIIGSKDVAVDLRTLVVEKSVFHFNKVQGTNSTAVQTTPMLLSGTGGFTWTASSSATWLQVSPTSGSGAATLSLQLNNADAALQSIGPNTATVTVSSPDAFNTATLTVTATVVGAPPPTGPFGQVDTPLQNATGIVGAIGVTGWALDDGAVESVKIYRNCLGLDGPGCQSILGRSLVYIGDAAFISGARPDAEAECASCPQKERAGWGYLLLTNMLPNVTANLGFGGQGTLLIYAIARDFDGNRTLLGRNRSDHSPTSITMANATISKPFGAIDTPSQGQIVSGFLANFGWALTTDTDNVADATDILIPTDGSTMTVVIDGVGVGTVAYNQCRGDVGNPVPSGQFCNDDVANVFGNPTPQAPFTIRASNPTKFRNLDAGRSAIGAFDIDTKQLGNGRHSIAWGVTDSQGRAEGIGSRDFTVLNGGSLFSESGLLNAPAEARGFASDLAALTPATRDVSGRTGFNFSAPNERIEAGHDGIRRVQIPEVGRLELSLGPVDRGHLVANGELRDLPPGSHLEPTTGRFTWMPLVGYVGTYRLAFIHDDELITIDVGIYPVAKAPAGQSEIRMTLDLPTSGQQLAGNIRVAGWAYDPRSAHGAGIGTVHVWAHRRDDADTTLFLGEATIGLQRPDVASAAGAQFDRTGFNLNAPALDAGAWEITAYVWNRRTSRWEDARTVTVTVQ